MTHEPLAATLRPNSLDEIAGQRHLVGPEGILRRIIERGRPLSILLCGPPGCGKTTLAKLYAKSFALEMVSFSAAGGAAADVKKMIKERESRPLLSKKLLLFVDEIHRFNKAQQDLFLPYVEKGSIILVGATTENPSFSINNALLSRLRVLELKPLNANELEQLLQRAEKHLGPLGLTDEARQALIKFAAGDGRQLLGHLEWIAATAPDKVDLDTLETIIQRRPANYDRDGDGHYQVISALHKSVRGSDPNATLYWLCRMLEGGEDPLFIARRLIRMASEDVGLADPRALEITQSAATAYERLGSPEGELALAEAAVYLCLAPKSNAIYTAYKAARTAAKETSALSPPRAFVNAVGSLMKEQGYGDGYQYDHDTPHAFSGQDYFPEELKEREFYHPVSRGLEREMQKRMDYFNDLRRKISHQ